MSAAQRRAQILDIAMLEFSRTGLFGTPVDVIARAAGVTQPYVFRLFGSKTKLFIECVQISFAQSTARMLDAAEGLSGVNALIAMGNQYRSNLENNPDVLIQTQAFAACAHEEVREAVREAYGDQWRQLAEQAGVKPVQMKIYMALGLLLNDLTMIDAKTSTSVDAQWVQDAYTVIDASVYSALGTLNNTEI
ncbi:TetR/AcrR family transcriptional regulator [Streptomyces canus]|uniref:TetR/AcrR family transcriptional regulator n=1 Tax=Streptomyces canus TaxID=58343 RepID=UPI002E2A0B8A|nr:TetR/AcrR family transcriptional regulator [Streptomyces canus]